MPETGFEDALAPDGNDQIRVRFTTVNGRVIRYTVQYETFIDGRWVPVMRYDNAHGAPHLDELNRDGKQVDKKWLPINGNAEALSAAIDEIREGWRLFRQRFESE